MEKRINLSSVKWLLKNLDKISVTNEWSWRYIECTEKEFSALGYLMGYRKVRAQQCSLCGSEYERDWLPLGVHISTYMAHWIWKHQDMPWFNIRQCYKLAWVILNSSTGLEDVDFRMKDNRRLYDMIEKSFINDLLKITLIGYKEDYIGWILDVKSESTGAPRFREQKACELFTRLEGAYDSLGEGNYEI